MQWDEDASDDHANFIIRSPSLVADGAKLHLRHTPAFPTSSGPREKRALSQASKCQQERQEAQGTACIREGVTSSA